MGSQPIPAIPNCSHTLLVWFAMLGETFAIAEGFAQMESWVFDGRLI
jgi:membrane protein YqaA with SNARE-associated domain